MSPTSRYETNPNNNLQLLLPYRKMNEEEKGQAEGNVRKRGHRDVVSYGVSSRSYDGLVSEVVAQTPHLHRPLDSVTIGDPVGCIDHQFGQL